MNFPKTLGLDTIIKSTRPKSQVKNLIIFAPLVFSNNIFNPWYLILSAITFISFTLLSGSIYIINDLFDRKIDAKSHSKSKRPIASGKLSENKALISHSILAAASIILSLNISPLVFVFFILYFVINIVYAVKLKHVVIIDALCISSGFIIRVVVGALAIGVIISKWLMICTMLLSLFLVFNKRRFELETKDIDRKVLKHYNKDLLNHLITVVTTLTIVSYMMYTVDPVTIEKFGNENIIFTIPFVIYGIFRFLYLIYIENIDGNIESAFKDCPLLLNIILWIIASIIAITI